MRIYIDVPELECARCGISGVHQPTLLQLAGKADKGAVLGQDTRGNRWKIGTMKMPVGWETVGVDLRTVCGDCVKSWRKATNKFFSGEPEIEAPQLSWPDVEAQERVQDKRKATIGGVIPSVRANNIVKVAPSMDRGTNIPQPVAAPALGRRIEKSQVLSQTGVVQAAPSFSPVPVATIAPLGCRPPAATVITARNTQPPQQQAARTTPTMEVVRSAPSARTIPLPSENAKQPIVSNIAAASRDNMMSTIPLAAENTRQPVVTNSLVLPSIPARVDPAPLQAEPIQPRYDRIIEAAANTYIDSIPRLAEPAGARYSRASAPLEEDAPEAEAAVEDLPTESEQELLESVPSDSMLLGEAVNEVA